MYRIIQALPCILVAEQKATKEDMLNICQAAVVLCHTFSSIVLRVLKVRNIKIFTQVFA